MAWLVVSIPGTVSPSDRHPPVDPSVNDIRMSVRLKLLVPWVLYSILSPAVVPTDSAASDDVSIKPRREHQNPTTAQRFLSDSPSLGYVALLSCNRAPNPSQCPTDYRHCAQVRWLAVSRTRGRMPSVGRCDVQRARRRPLDYLNKARAEWELAAALFAPTTPTGAFPVGERTERRVVTPKSDFFGGLMNAVRVGRSDSA